MNHFEQLKKQLRSQIFVLLLSVNVVLALIALVLIRYVNLPLIVIVPALIVMSIICALVLSNKIINRTTSPLKDVWQGLVHILPGSRDSMAPDLDTVEVGKELVSAMLTQIYKLASQTNQPNPNDSSPNVVLANYIVNHLPIPLIVFNKDQTVVATSPAAVDYCSPDKQPLAGKLLYDTIDLEFSSEPTLEKWIEDCKQNKVIDTTTWQRVRLRLANNEVKQCDIVAYFNRDNSGGGEFMLVFIDQSKLYAKSDDEIGFIALAVHELRTPLTILRGYMEVFDEELQGKLNPEQADFLQRMIVSTKQLSSFFNNILNVIRIDQNQLALNLTESNWADILQPACNELEPKAKVHNQHLQVEIAPDLPPVAVDRYSIIEVINNLVDNALKYTPEEQTIIIRSKLNQQGNVETTVQDHGPGIPASLIPNLFDKFYRSHRSASKVGGTGIGLYISKAIVNSHGGEIWVQSKEGEGSIFGFTLLPAVKLADELKSSNNKGIVRNAHGWIKNHNLYRR